MYDFEKKDEKDYKFCFCYWWQGGGKSSIGNAEGSQMRILYLLPDKICQFDVYWSVIQVVYAMEVIVIEAKTFQVVDIERDIGMNNWQKSLKDMSKIPYIFLKPDEAVIKILDFLPIRSLTTVPEEFYTKWITITTIAR